MSLIAFFLLGVVFNLKMQDNVLTIY